jgi:hypothetical protein
MEPDYVDVNWTEVAQDDGEIRVTLLRIQSLLSNGYQRRFPVGKADGV